MLIKKFLTVRNRWISLGIVRTVHQMMRRRVTKRGGGGGGGGGEGIAERAKHSTPEIRKTLKI